MTARLRIDVFTIFPEIIDQFTSHSLLGRARVDGLVEINSHNLRDGAHDVHHSVDDAPYGGGAGMVLKPEPVFEVVESVQPPRPLLLLSPGGQPFDQEMADNLAQSGGFSLLCGRYEGVDERIRAHLVDGEVSIGDVVVSGGEVGALMIIEATCRLVPGVMGNDFSAASESFRNELLEYPHYTRPATFRDWSVPDVLRSGDHERIAHWRYIEALRRTLERRPDLIAKRGGLSDDEAGLLGRDTGDI